eukprot:TRINITY_DN272_c0_g1_i14.p2 TRINITY_DN272_c0_g1~~TRINITY_DN272_c0_g1_i14.p2  ORF type:complete len:103 (+),score=3.95 TRINITY_DN272_c0_g1_i14:233-541(+)
MKGKTCDNGRQQITPWRRSAERRDDGNSCEQLNGPTRPASSSPAQNHHVRPTTVGGPPERHGDPTPPPPPPPPTPRPRPHGGAHAHRAAPPSTCTAARRRCA